MSNEKTMVLADVPVGELFKIGRYEFIKFTDDNGQVVAVSKDSLYQSSFGQNNNFATSDILKRLHRVMLNELEEIVGAENIIEHDVDLLSLDGSGKYGKVKAKISIITFEICHININEPMTV